MAGEDYKPEKMCSELAGTHFMIKKINSDEISRVQKVRHWINHGILQNSEQISQPSFYFSSVFDSDEERKPLQVKDCLK